MVLSEGGKMIVKEFKERLENFPDYLEVKMCYTADYGGGTAAIFKDVALTAVGGATGATMLVITELLD